MKELIKITDINGRKVVSARELHTFLEVETPPRLWFPRMLEYGFESGIDFEEVQISTPSGQTANDSIDFRHRQRNCHDSKDG